MSKSNLLINKGSSLTKGLGRYLARQLSSIQTKMQTVNRHILGEDDENVVSNRKHQMLSHKGPVAKEIERPHYVSTLFEKSIVSNQPANARFDSEVPFTYVLVLQKTKLWHEHVKYARKIVACHKGILDALDESGFDCVLLQEDEFTNKYKKHGVVVVGLRHSSEQTMKSLYDRYSRSPKDEESGYILSPADILRLTDYKIRATLEAYNIRLKGDDWAKLRRLCEFKLEMEDLIPYDPRHPERSMVLDFFPLDLGDNAAKVELGRRFWVAVKDSFRKPLNPYVFMNFCDNIEWLYGTNVATYFYFALYTFQFLAVLTFSSLIIFILCCIFAVAGQDTHDGQLLAAQLRYGLDGLFGIITIVAWYPLWTRYWARLYSVLKVRWEIDERKLTNGLDSNPKAFFKLVYDPEIGSMVKRYPETWRFCMRIIGYPLYFLLFLFITVLFIWVAILFASSMQLPQCEDCEGMMKYSDRSVFDLHQAERNLYDHPYGRWYPHLRNENVSYEEYTYGWIGQTLLPTKKGDKDNATAGRCPFLFTERPEDCYSTFPFFFPFITTLFFKPSTCWKNEGLFGGSTLPAALYSIVMGGALSNLVVFISTKINALIVKGENWATITQADTALAQRNFFMAWITAFAMNLIQVFVFVRYGHVIFHWAYKECIRMADELQLPSRGQDGIWQDSLQYGNSWFYWGGFALAGFPPGIWDPGNELLDGEFIGLIFDFLLMKLVFNVLGMLYTLIRTQIRKKRIKIGAIAPAPVSDNSSRVTSRVGTPLRIAETKDPDKVIVDEVKLLNAVNQIEHFLRLSISKIRVVNRMNYDRVSNIKAIEEQFSLCCTTSEDAPLLGDEPAKGRRSTKTKMMIAVERFSQSQIDMFEASFNQLDANNNGLVSTTELSSIFSDVKETLSSSALSSFLEEVDNDGDAMLDFDEFLYMMTIIDDASPDTVLESFKILDPENSGFVLTTKLREYITTTGHEKLTNEEVDEIIREADVDADGRLNYQEFITAIKSFDMPSFFDKSVIPQKGWRIVSTLRYFNTVNTSWRKSTPLLHRPGSITAAKILTSMERGSFNSQVDLLDIVMRAAVVMFFSVFLPLISFFSMLFLFAQLVLQLYQLLYYYQRPKPSLQHNPDLLLWRMEMFMFLAIPFVVLYFITVTTSMLTCSHAEIQPITFGSLGIYHCSEYDSNETFSEVFNPPKMLLGMALIPGMLLSYRLVLHCVQSEPAVVRKTKASKVSRQRLEMEDVKLSKLLPQELRRSLSDLFDNMMVWQHMRQKILEACLTAIPNTDNLAEVLSVCKQHGALSSWSETQLAIHICQNVEDYDVELVKRMVDERDIIDLFPDELSSSAAEDMAARLLTSNLNVVDLEDQDIVQERGNRLTTLMKGLLAKRTKTKDGLDKLLRYLGPLDKYSTNSAQQNYSNYFKVPLPNPPNELPTHYRTTHPNTRRTRS